MAEEETVHRHEERDVDVGATFKFGIGVLLGTILVLFLSWLMLMYFLRREERYDVAPPPLAAERPSFTGPRLQISPRLDLDRLRQAETEVLEGYGWVDRQQGIVHIPVERAMELLAKRGLPTGQGGERETEGER